MTTVRTLRMPLCAQLPAESPFLSDKASIATV
jgi:hypothetical protein